MKLHISALVLAAFAGVALTTQSAWADARQDVMAGAQRCAGISDDRTWLDCFYGSAQPMRGRLGLPPAPVNQQRLVPPGQALPAPAYAAPAYAPAYAPPAYPSYAAPAPAPAPGNRAPAEMTANGTPVPPPLPRRRNTGFFTSVFGNSKAIVSNVRMLSWTKRNGLFVVTLADGQMWQQNNGDPGVPAWKTPVSRYVVNVYEGALGTYNLNVSDDSQLYKVHRIN